MKLKGRTGQAGFGPKPKGETVYAGITRLLRDSRQLGHPEVRRISLTQDLKNRLLDEGFPSGSVFASPECMAVTEPGSGLVRIVFADVLIAPDENLFDVQQPVTFSRDGSPSRILRNLLGKHFRVRNGRPVQQTGPGKAAR